MSGLRNLTCGIAVAALGAQFAIAADQPRPDRLPDYYTPDGKPQWHYVPPEPVFYPPPRYIQTWEGELGGRYWFSSGTTQLDLYGTAPSRFLVSRLTYDGLHAHAGEIFGRVEHVTGWFVKGYAGLGRINSGNLQDEDFVTPFFPIYSSTNSDQDGGRLSYASIDLGWAWRTAGYKFGFFVGYFYYSDKLNAYGCIQTASNPDVCVPSILTSTLIITQETKRHAVRLGVNGEVRFLNGWRVSGEVAWLPYATLSGKDFHWLRIPTDFSGPTPERGSTTLNVQIELMLNYDFANGFSAGLGGRYWNLGSGNGESFAHFEDSANGAIQSLSLRTERWGGFLQASYRFGEVPSLSGSRRARF